MADLSLFHYLLLVGECDLVSMHNALPSVETSVCSSGELLQQGEDPAQ